MPGGIHWHSRPQDIIAAAKARAKAALKEQNPRLTSLDVPSTGLQTTRGITVRVPLLARLSTLYLIPGHLAFPRKCKSQPLSKCFFTYGPSAWNKNKTRIEMTLSPWYGDKIKELRAGSGFETDTGFAKWLV